MIEKYFVEDGATSAKNQQKEHGGFGYHVRWFDVDRGGLLWFDMVSTFIQKILK